MEREAVTLHNPTPWAPLYADPIRYAAETHHMDPTVLLAVAWQESAGGVYIDGGQWRWHPGRLYRYEPGFWDRYLNGKAEWVPPSNAPATVEAWKRRVSASYGLMQVMYPTAISLGMTRASPPECLFDPYQSCGRGAQLLRKLLDGPAAGKVDAALAAYNTGRARPELTHYDDEVLAKLARIRAFADTGADPFGG